MAETPDEFLRAPLPRSFERLADDLLIGRHGDPHVAFAVLVYPDRAPAIIAITARQSGAHDVSGVVASDPEDPKGKPDKGRFWVFSDLDDASHALGDARFAFRSAAWQEERTLGEHIGYEVQRQWEGRRLAAIERELAAEHQRSLRPARCEVCGGRYTERGITMHQRRAVYCSRVLAERAAEAAAEEA